MLGDLFYRGRGVSRNIFPALVWAHMAAEQGCARGQYLLGFIFEVEEKFRDLARAVTYYQKSADQGFSKAQLRLASLITAHGPVPAPEVGPRSN